MFIPKLVNTKFAIKKQKKMEDSANVESTNEEKNVASLKSRKRKTEEAEQNILEDIEFRLQHDKITKLYEESSQKLYERSRFKNIYLLYRFYNKFSKYTKFIL